MENRENVQALHKKHSDHLKINITGVRFYDTYIYFCDISSRRDIYVMGPYIILY